MPNYYGRSSSSDFLMHYGIKGMHWGVRKAIARNDYRALSKNYSKAEKKLQRLLDKANTERQHDISKEHLKKAGTHAVAGAGMLGVSEGAKFLGNLPEKYVAPLLRNSKIKAVKYTSRALPIGAVNSAQFKPIELAGKGGTIGAGVLTGYHLGKAALAKYRESEKGHQKAVQKAETWRKEMKKAFKGTKYTRAMKVQDIVRDMPYKETKRKKAKKNG